MTTTLPRANVTFGQVEARPWAVPGPQAAQGEGDPHDDQMDEVLRALAGPRRRAILQLVSHSELSPATT